MDAEVSRHIRVVVDAVEALPDGLVKTHMRRSIDALSETLASLAPRPPGASEAERPRSSLTHTVGGGLAQHTSRLARAAQVPIPNAHAALFTAIHALLLRDCGLTCTGATDAPDASGFAPAVRALPPGAFLPPGWSSGDGTAFTTRYSRPPPGGASGSPATTVLLSAVAVGPTLSLHARTTTRRPHVETSLDLDVRVYTTTTGEGGDGAPPHTNLEDILSPLEVEGRGVELRDKVWACLVQPLLPAAETPPVSGGGHAGLAPPSGAWPLGSGRTGQGLPGIPVPLTGRPGDFDRDLFPDLGGVVPGGALFTGRAGRGGDGMTVGPGHPMFGPLGPPGHGGLGGMPGGGGGFALPPGVPPGARFDPFGPPGTGVGGLGGGGGGRGHGTFGPNPDHLRPPQDDNPPDIYW